MIDANDTIIEDTNGGTDTVIFASSYSLGANLENLTLAGTGAFAGTGNSLDNLLTGNSGNNTLTGDSGNDTLIGGVGSDSLVGGSGNDLYIVDSSDTVVEATNAGIDTVRTDISYTLGANVENLTFTGASNVTGTGNSLDNILIGNSGNNILYGGDGKDTLDGSAGADTLTGGAGNDSYIIDNSGDSVVESGSAGTDTVTSSVTVSALFANVENLILTGSQKIDGTGNSLNNLIMGNRGANVLNGGAGVDTLEGGAGNATYVIDSTDVVTEAVDAGTDTVQIDASYSLGANLENLTLLGSGNWSGTGNVGRNWLTGNSGNNSLNGGAGNDTLEGGLGVDT
ncbi:MAG: calcium-binding protein, partial [Pseudomonadota bacterium]